MMRRYVLSLMILLTLAIAARTGMTMWKHHGMTSNRNEVSLMVPAVHATEAAKTKPQPSTSNMPSIISTAEASVFPGAPGQSLTPGELNMLENLRQMKRKLDRRAKALDAREKAVKDAEAKAADRIAQLQKLVSSIQDQLQQEQQLKSKKIKKLASVYDTMKPDKAAPMIELMDMKTTVMLLSRMDEKKVGKVLSFMPPKTAMKISEALTERIASLQGK